MKQALMDDSGFSEALAEYIVDLQMQIDILRERVSDLENSRWPLSCSPGIDPSLYAYAYEDPIREGRRTPLVAEILRVLGEH
jgi:hypothetical protein